MPRIHGIVDRGLSFAELLARYQWYRAPYRPVMLPRHHFSVPWATSTAPWWSFEDEDELVELNRLARDLCTAQPSDPPSGGPMAAL